jgi:hypothetical protein
LPKYKRIDLFFNKNSLNSYGFIILSIKPNKYQYNEVIHHQLRIVANIEVKNVAIIIDIIILKPFIFIIFLVIFKLNEIIAK